MRQPSLVLVLFAGIVLGAVAVTMVLVMTSRRAAPPRLAGASTTFTNETAAALSGPGGGAVSRVASSFICSCGKCTNPLDNCTCSVAAEERGFIQDQLLAGQSEADVTNAVKQKYGGLKS